MLPSKPPAPRARPGASMPQSATGCMPPLRNRNRTLTWGPFDHEKHGHTSLAHIFQTFWSFEIFTAIGLHGHLDFFTVICRFHGHLPFSRSFAVFHGHLPFFTVIAQFSQAIARFFTVSPRQINLPLRDKYTRMAMWKTQASSSLATRSVPRPVLSGVRKRSIV